MTENMDYKLLLGDCLDKLKELEDNSVDSIVTDPPYGISFMGKKWDYDVPSIDIWNECLRVLKPGGHLLSFSGSRTYHRMTCAIEDAGFEIRDQIMWVYGSGFPKSHNVAIGIDKQLGLQNNRGKRLEYAGNTIAGQKVEYPKGIEEYIPKSDEAKQWEGWGTALKPAHEPICLARKPLAEKTVAKNVLEYGTGALHIDACRIGDEILINPPGFDRWNNYRHGKDKYPTETNNSTISQGRWPANFIHDGSEEVVSLFPNTGSSTPCEKNKTGGEFPEDNTIKLGLKEIRRTGFDDSGSAARYFYCSKASKKDRNEGCEDLELKPAGSMDANNPLCGSGPIAGAKPIYAQNNHPTVKPTDLMRYLIRLVTPKNGTVLDPFMGSGSTGKAAMLENKSFIGIELSEEYLNVAEKRIKHIITELE